MLAEVVSEGQRRLPRPSLACWLPATCIRGPAWLPCMIAWQPGRCLPCLLTCHLPSWLPGDSWPAGRPARWQACSLEEMAALQCMTFGSKALRRMSPSSDAAHGHIDFPPKDFSIAVHAFTGRRFRLRGAEMSAFRVS